MPAILSAILSLLKGVILNPKIIGVIGIPAAFALIKRLLLGGSINMGDKLKEVKDVLVLVIDGIQAGEAALSDGHIGLEDIAKAVTLFPDIVEAVKGCTDIPAELAAMSEADAADLVSFVESKFPPLGGKGQAITDAGLKAAFAIWKLVQAIQAPAAAPAPAAPVPATPPSA